MESCMQSWRPRTTAFCNFSSPYLWSMAPATKKWCQVTQSAAPVTQNHLPETENLMLQNATALRKSAPCHGTCIFPDPLQMSTPAIAFGHARKPSRFAHFWPGAHSLAPATQNHIWTSKSAPNLSVFNTFDLGMCFAAQRRALFWHLNFQSAPSMVCFVHFDLEMCFAPQRRALFRHHNFQKWSEHGVFCTFWLGRACNFSSLIWPHGSAPAASASQLFDPPEPPCFATLLLRAPASSFFSLFLCSSLFCFSLLWLFAPLLFHLAILSEVWLLNFLRLWYYIGGFIMVYLDLLILLMCFLLEHKTLHHLPTKNTAVLLRISPRSRIMPGFSGWTVFGNCGPTWPNDPIEDLGNVFFYGIVVLDDNQYYLLYSQYW